MGNHSINFKLQYKDTFKNKIPEVHLKDNIFLISFNDNGTDTQKRNYKYVLHYNLTIIEKTNPIIVVMNITENEINISHKEKISVLIMGLNFSKVNILLNNNSFKSYSCHESPFFLEIPTVTNRYYYCDNNYLDIGRYNLTFEFFITNSNIKYLPIFKKNNSTSIFEFKENETTLSTNDYIYRFNTILNITKNKKETIINNIIIF